MELTKSDEPDDDYLNDDKNSEYDYEEGGEKSSSPASDPTVSDKPTVSSRIEIKGVAGKSVTLKCDGEGFENSDTIVMYYNRSQLIYQGQAYVMKDERIEFNKKDGR